MIGKVLVLLFANIKTCSSKQFDCDSCTETVKVVHDTVWPVNKPQIVVIGKPNPIKTYPGKKQPVKADTVYLPGGTIVIHDKCPENSPTAFDSGRFYAIDTTFDQVHLILQDSVNGAINWRKLAIKNLKPEVTTTITKTVKEKVKLYIGGNVTIPANNLKSWGIGPSILFTVPKVGGISYYYDAKNNAHTGGIYALIRFKKK